MKIRFNKEVNGVYGYIVGEEYDVEQLIFRNDNNCVQCVNMSDNIKSGAIDIVNDDDTKMDNPTDSVNIKIKYFEGATKLEKIAKGDWIDLYANKDIFIPEGERAMIPLGIAMELPRGYEAHVVPRSSTFKTWGIIQTNHMGVIDNSYSGDNDQWHFPAYCLEGKEYYMDLGSGVTIRRGDKICQFRIEKCQPKINFQEVDSLGNADRGSFGSTGTK